MSENVLKFPGTKPAAPVEVYTEVKTYLANVKCPRCEVGTMTALPVEQMLLQARTLGTAADFNKSPHRCDQCSHEESYIERYPTIRYFRAGQEPTSVA